MKFQKSELYNNLRILKNVIPPRTTMPAYEGVLIQGKEMVANNLSLSMTIGIDNQADENFIIPSAAIDFIGKLPNGEISITDEGNQTIKIKAKSIENNFRTFDGSEFAIPTKILKPKDHNVFNGEELIKAAKKVIGTVAKQNIKQVLECLYMTNKNGCVEMVGCDGYRIAIVELKKELKESDNIDILMPLKTIETVIKQNITGNMSIHDQNETATFYFYEKTLTTRLISGQYVNYKSMVDAIKGKGTKLTIERKIFKEALDRVTTVQKSSLLILRKPIVINVKDNLMTFSLTNETAEHSESFEIKDGEGFEFEAAYNPLYFEEAAKHIESDEFNLTLKDEKTPSLIEDIEEGYKYIIMAVIRK